MKEQEMHSMSLADHFVWCRGERASMRQELIKYEKRTRRVSNRKDATSLTRGAATHVVLKERHPAPGYIHRGSFAAP